MGTFPKNLESQLNSKPVINTIWNETRYFIKTNNSQDKDTLVEEGYLVKKDNLYTMTPQAKLLIVQLDNYFIKAKKKTDSQLMGKNFVDKINNYREIFSC